MVQRSRHTCPILPSGGDAFVNSTLVHRCVSRINPKAVSYFGITLRL